MFGRGFLNFFVTGDLLGLPMVVFSICSIGAILFLMAENRARRTRSDVEAYLIGIFRHEFQYNAMMSFVIRVLNAVRKPWFRKHPFYISAEITLPPMNRTVNQALLGSVANTSGNYTPPEAIESFYKRFWQYITLSPKDLIAKYGGQLIKLKTCVGDEIHLMYVPSIKKFKSKTLVICCEGNSGFIGQGIMVTPIKAGYSVLGWHHPGPSVNTYNMALPSQGVCTVDAVVQYAMKKLHFTSDNIVMYGWSIGGFTAASAAVKHDLKGLVLDATFDNLLPVVNKFMPMDWSAYVVNVVKLHLDLNIAKLVMEYKRPVHIIRRTQDMVTSMEPYNLSSDRGNNLLKMLIGHRFCDLVGESPSAQRMIEGYVNLLDSERLHIENNTYTEENEWTVLALLRTYARDFEAEHNTQLPVEDFEEVIDNINSHDYNIQVVLIKRYYYQHPPPKYVPLYKLVRHNMKKN